MDIFLNHSNELQATVTLSFRVLHQFVVNLLLHSSGHLLLVNTLGTGVNTIDRITSQAIGYNRL